MAENDRPATHAIRPSQLVVTRRIAIPGRELDIHFARSSGPGGQHVNKVSTKALLRWNVGHSEAVPAEVRDRFLQRYATRITADGDILLASDRQRSRKQNADECLRRLRAMLAAVAEPPKARRATRPSRAAVERRLSQKRHHAEKKRRRRFRELE